MGIASVGEGVSVDHAIMLPDPAIASNYLQIVWEICARRVVFGSQFP